MALTSSSHFRVATDSRTGLPLADYSWLPQRLHSAFQAMLELDDGIALLHFACEVVMIHVQQPSPTTFSSSAARARQLLQPTETNTVLLVSPDALYFCSPGGDIMEAIPVDAIDSILLCDHWMCLCTPSTPRDTVFALVQHGAGGAGSSLSPPRRTTGRELPQRQQDFIAILNAIRVMKDVRRIAPMVLDSHYAIVSRLQQPQQHQSSTHPVLVLRGNSC
ncbi:Hypothetical protein, putative [Bodo saltans]|uniref:Uncharacterized protein n=1 Tax=Bodo saltans TaxID=75058 RepID=A0A0S4J116_BODSA|nr:Hypothetical protein, putative [Bodo saltans]|eukprot:CUG77458.1 Hypothetical protein, putative [Bodo saltans]